MNLFPHNSTVDVQKISLIFKNTTTSYKFYWFKAKEIYLCPFFCRMKLLSNLC